MTKRLATMFLASVLAACGVGAPPSTGGNTGGNGDGTGGDNGDGTGGGNGNGSGGSTSSMNATTFLAQMAQKFCDKAFMCKSSFPTDAGVTFNEAFGATLQECISDAAAADMPAQVEAAITSGKIKFNGADAAACVAGLAFGTCQAFWTDDISFPQPCATAMVGTVADGAACTVDYECSNGASYCDPTTNKCTVDMQNARLTPTF